jgi:hypothetical protein
MVSRVAVMIVVASMAAGSMQAQQDKRNAHALKNQLAIKQADADKRAALAEALVQSRETPGRELDAAFRRELVDLLKKESVEQLELRLSSGNLAISPNALGDTKADLVYSTFQKACRIIDTRVAGAGGALVPGSPRHFKVAGTVGFEFQGGTAGGCAVPNGASAVMINFVAVAPTAQGNLQGAAFPNAIPATGSILNYQLLSPQLNIANGLLFPICDWLSNPFDYCTMDMTLQANGGGTHVVADVLGYTFRFPKEQVKNFAIERFNTGDNFINGSTCTNYEDSSGVLTISSGVPGKVWVRATVQMKIINGGFCGDDSSSRFYLWLAWQPTDTPVCGNFSNFAYLDTWALKCGSDDNVAADTNFVNLPLDGVFTLPAFTSMRIAINGTGQVSSGDTAEFWYSTIVAEFVPD